MRVLGLSALAAAAAGGVVGYRLVVSGDLTLDTGVGRTLRPLGPLAVTITAPRTTVFEVIAAPYLARTTRAMAEEISVLERGSDMVLAAHRTPVRGGPVATTVETVRFTRPTTVDFRLLRGPVPHVVERFTLDEDGETTARLQRGARYGLLESGPLVGRAGRSEVGGDRLGVARPHPAGSGTTSHERPLAALTTKTTTCSSTHCRVGFILMPRSTIGTLCSWACVGCRAG